MITGDDDDGDAEEQLNPVQEAAFKTLSSKYGLIVDENTGDIYSRKACNEEEQEELDRLWEDYLQQQGPPQDNGQYDDDGDNGVVQEHRGIELHEWQIDAEERKRQHFVTVSGSRKRNIAPLALQECHYYGCQKEFDGLGAVTAPHPNGGNEPDLEYTFCSAKCAASFAEWEVGLPCSEKMRKILEQRVGHKIELLPPPCDMLVAQMGGMRLRNDEASLTAEEIETMGASHAQRQQRHDRGKSHKMVDETMEYQQQQQQKTKKKNNK